MVGDALGGVASQKRTKPCGGCAGPKMRMKAEPRAVARSALSGFSMFETPWAQTAVEASIPPRRTMALKWTRCMTENPVTLPLKLPDRTRITLKQRPRI